jgi:hypothetical protein
VTHVLRPREEFPTPAFRLVCGLVCGGAAAVLWLLLWTKDGRWDRVVLWAAVAVGTALAVVFGRSVHALLVACAGAVLLVTAVFLVELAL